MRKWNECVRSAVRRISLLVAVLFVSGSAGAQYQPSGCLNSDEEQLAQLVNEYRAENALPPIPVGQNLTDVAQWHTADLAYASFVSGTFGQDPSCNLHTWYGIPGAPYTTCCYTSDHAQAACMWNKPGEVSGGSYSPYGFEIAAWGYSTVEAALDGWKNSSGHDDVILNNPPWNNYTWRAMGIGVDPINRWYFVWFADTVDPDGDAEACTEGQPVPALGRVALVATATLLILSGFAFRGRRRLRLWG